MKLFLAQILVVTQGSTTNEIGKVFNHFSCFRPDTINSEGTNVLRKRFVIYSYHVEGKAN